MKKVSVFFLVSFLSVLILSCNSKSLPSLIGKWESTVTLKSDLAGGNSDAPVLAYLYTKQKTTLAFSEGGVFTKSVEQVVDHVDLTDSKENADEAKQYFSQYFNKNLVFDGEYFQKNQFINFLTLYVGENRGEQLPYIDFFAKDPSIGSDEYSLSYKVKNEELVIDGVTYKRID
jgi:hypothetical protein